MPFECASCDTETPAATLPDDWQTRASSRLGTYCLCPNCVAKSDRPALTCHNGPPETGNSTDTITGAAQTRLRTIVERIERLEEDKTGIMADIKEIYDEAKGEGFDVKILRQVVRLRKQDPLKREEEGAVLDLYLTAIGDR